MQCVFCKKETTSLWEGIRVQTEIGEMCICSSECYQKHHLHYHINQCSCGRYVVIRSSAYADAFAGGVFDRIRNKDFSYPAPMLQICSKCRPKKLVMCKYCGKSYPLVLVGLDGVQHWNRVVCECRKKCKVCGNLVSDNETFPNEEGCVQCVPLVPLNRHDFKPNKFNFIKTRLDPTGQLFFGIELEIHTGRSTNPDIIRTLVARADKFDTVAYFVHDGSITPGFEIVSHPMTLTSWKKDTNPLWEGVEKLKKFLPMDEYIKHPSCGLHIHMTKNVWTREKVAKLLEFIYSNPRFMVLLSERDFNKVRDPRTGKTYCKFDPENKDEKSEQLYHNDKYVIVNFRNETTIEFRCFKSIPDKDHILKCIEFCYAMFLWTDVIEKEEAWDVQKFSRFVFERRDLFSSLTTFFSKNSF